MPQIWIDIEDNDNSGYHPQQTFEQTGEIATAAAVIVPIVSGGDGPHEIVGWCQDGGGGACEVSYALVGDSGAGVSRLVWGGDNGIRLRAAGSTEAWSLDADGQFGEPYMLLNPEIAVSPA